MPPAVAAVGLWQVEGYRRRAQGLGAPAGPFPSVGLELGAADLQGSQYHGMVRTGVNKEHCVVFL